MSNGRLIVEGHSSVVECDLPDIYAFIARDNVAAAERVLEAVDATFRQLAEHPECGVTYPTRQAKLKGIRMLPVNGFPKYLIFYRLESDRARVLYVVHGARHLLRLFRSDARE